MLHSSIFKTAILLATVILGCLKTLQGKVEKSGAYSLFNTLNSDE